MDHEQFEGHIAKEQQEYEPQGVEIMRVLEVEQVGPHELAEKRDGGEGKNGHGGLEAELVRDSIGEDVASVLRVEELPRRLYDVV